MNEMQENKKIGNEKECSRTTKARMIQKKKNLHGYEKKKDENRAKLKFCSNHKRDTLEKYTIWL